MKQSVSVELSPAEAEHQTELIEAVKQFWIDLEMSGEAGATTWDELDPIRDRVTWALATNPPDVSSAVQQSFRAKILISGQTNL
jgi:hypothetical protein